MAAFEVHTDAGQVISFGGETPVTWTEEVHDDPEPPGFGLSGASTIVIPDTGDGVDYSVSPSMTGTLELTANGVVEVEINVGYRFSDDTGEIVEHHALGLFVSPAGDLIDLPPVGVFTATGDVSGHVWVEVVDSGQSVTVGDASFFHIAYDYEVPAVAGRKWWVGTVGWATPAEPVTFDYVYAPDASTVTHSAEIGSLTYASGDYLFDVLMTHGNATFHGPSVGVWTGQLSTTAPAAPRRAYAYDRIADETGDDSLAWTWDAPGVDAVALTIAAHEPGLALFAQDWWSDGPDTAFSSPGFSLHRGVVVFTWSDAGTTVDGATLVSRSDGGDVPSVGVVEIWSIPGVAAPASTTVDIDVTALSGNIQWATWIDIYSV